MFLVDFYRCSPECLLGVDKPYYHYRCNLSDSASHIFQVERLEDNFYLSDAIAETVREWDLQDSPSHRGLWKTAACWTCSWASKMCA